MTKTQEDFLMEELKYIRTRISEISKEIFMTEYYYITAVLAVYYFIFTSELCKNNIKFANILLFVPILMFFYGLLRYNSLRGLITRHDTYIFRIIEPQFLKSNADTRIGFVSHYYYGRDPADKAAHQHVQTRLLLWMVGCAISISIAVMGICGYLKYGAGQ